MASLVSEAQVLVDYHVLNMYPEPWKHLFSVRLRLIWGAILVGHEKPGCHEALFAQVVINLGCWVGWP